MSGQDDRRTRKGAAENIRYPFSRLIRTGDYFPALSFRDSYKRQDGPWMVRITE
jgi:hypothetical protein